MSSSWVPGQAPNFSPSSTMTSTPCGGLSALAAGLLGGQVRMFATKRVRIHVTGQWDMYKNLKMTLSPQD